MRHRHANRLAVGGVSLDGLLPYFIRSLIGVHAMFSALPAHESTAPAFEVRDAGWRAARLGCRRADRADRSDPSSGSCRLEKIPRVAVRRIPPVVSAPRRSAGRAPRRADSRRRSSRPGRRRACRWPLCRMGSRFEPISQRGVFNLISRTSNSQMTTYVCDHISSDNALRIRCRSARSAA